MQDFSQVKIGDVLCLVINVHDRFDSVEFHASIPFNTVTFWAKVKAIVLYKEERQIFLDLSGVYLYSPKPNCYQCTDDMVFISRDDHDVLTGHCFRDSEKILFSCGFDVIHASVL